MTPRFAMMMPALAVLLLVAPACSSEEHAAQRKAAVENAAAVVPAGATNARPRVPTASRLIAYETELELRTKSPESAGRELRSLAAEFGGYVVSSEAQDDGREGATVRVRLRVDARRLEEALGKVRALGRVHRELTKADDQTEAAADLGARLSAEQKLESRYLELLAKANAVAEMLPIERELSAVRTRIEQLTAQQRELDQRTTTALIDVSVRPLAGPMLEAASGGSTLELLGHHLGMAVADAQRVAVGGVILLIRLLGVFAPLLLLAGIGALLARVWWLRRARAVARA